MGEPVPKTSIKRTPGGRICKKKPKRPPKPKQRHLVALFTINWPATYN